MEKQLEMHSNTSELAALPGEAMYFLISMCVKVFLSRWAADLTLDTVGSR